MFRPLWGGTANPVGTPASASPGRVSPAWPWRRLLAACGGGSSDANEKAGTYEVKVVNAEFPTEQHLGQTSLLRIGVRNSGKKTVPAMAVTVSIAGKEGADLLPPLRDPRPPARNSPSPTGRSGSWPKASRSSPAPKNPAAPTHLEPQDLRPRRR